MKLKQYKLSKALRLNAIKRPLKKAFKKALRYTLKLRRKGARKLLSQALRFAKFQLGIRPRARLILRVIPALIVAFILSSQAVAYLEPKRAEVKINGQTILVADKTEPEEITAEVSLAVASRRSPFDFKSPVDGHITQGYSSYHPAFDIATAYGSPIKPLGAGRVEFAGSVTGGKGNIAVGVGNEVNPEMTLGTVGMTGRTTGPHVHLEIYDNGITANPGSILPEAN